MGVPKRRTSTQRKGKRKAGKRFRLSALSLCPDCGQLKHPHQVCHYCQSYKNIKGENEKSSGSKAQKKREDN